MSTTPMRVFPPTPDDRDCRAQTGELDLRHARPDRTDPAANDRRPT